METGNVPVVLEADLLALLPGPLDEVLAKLTALKVKYEADYSNLAIQENTQQDLGGEEFTSFTLVGVPNYSQETQERISQFKALLAILPREAVLALTSK